jgi:hypothetical protein
MTTFRACLSIVVEVAPDTGFGPAVVQLYEPGKRHARRGRVHSSGALAVDDMGLLRSILGRRALHRVRLVDSKTGRLSGHCDWR